MNNAQLSSQDQVFDRPLYLSGILDNAADSLSATWFGYDWNDRSRCNCGVVAREVIQTSSSKLKELLPPIYENGKFYPTWISMTERFCTVTGLSENQVYRRLFEAGFHYSDFFHLETLGNATIVQQMAPLRKVELAVSCARKSDVIAYLRTWAIGIERFHDAKLSVQTVRDSVVS